MTQRKKKSTAASWSLARIGAWASIAGIPLAILLWYLNAIDTGRSSGPDKTMTSQGNNSPVIEAGRDAIIGEQLPKNENTNELSSGNEETTTQDRSSKMSSRGDNSPVISAGRDAVINNVIAPKADFVTDHDGAGALLMKEPDFKAFVESTLSGSGPKVIGRLINGTEVSKVELREADMDEPSPPWAKVKVLQGDFKDSTGWILMNSLRIPN